MILESSNLSYFTTSLLEGLIDDLIDYIKILNLDNENKKKIFKIPPKIYFLLININLTISSFYPILNNIKELKNFLYQQSWATYNAKETEFWSYDENFFHEYQKLIFLQNIDFYWAKHLINMDFIKQAVMWESYAQKDPFLAYLEKAEYLFNLTLKDIRDFSLCEILSIEIKDV
jgi:preprotein translocase subunit SecA